MPEPRTPLWSFRPLGASLVRSGSVLFLGWQLACAPRPRAIATSRPVGPDASAGSQSEPSAGKATGQEPPPPSPLILDTERTLSWTRTRGGVAVCRSFRPDLARPFAALTLTRFLDPVDFELVRAWLRDASAPALKLSELPPCRAQLVCGTFSGSDPDALFAAADSPPPAAFYRSRVQAADAFEERLTRPAERALLLAQLLVSRRGALEGDLRQLPLRVSLAQLEKTWKAASAHAFWITTSLDPPPRAEAERTLEAQSRAAGSFTVAPLSQQVQDNPQPMPPEALPILLDRDPAPLGALVVWARPPHLSGSVHTGHTPAISASLAGERLDAPSHFALRLRGKSASALLQGVVNLVQANSVQANGVQANSMQANSMQANGVQANSEVNEGFPFHQDFAAPVGAWEESLDAGCSRAYSTLLEGPGAPPTTSPPLGHPGIVLLGFTPEDDTEVTAALADLPHVQLLVADGNRVRSLTVLPASSAP